MSIILDALKKLDRERAGRREGPPNIDTEILRPGPPLRRKRVPLYFATLFFTAVAATVITYAVVVWFGSPSKSGPPVPVSSPAPEPPVNSALPEVSSLPKPVPPAPKSSPIPKPQAKPVAPKEGSPPKSGPPTSMSSSPPKQPIEPPSSESNPPTKPTPSVTPNQQVIPNPPSPEPARSSSEETKQEPSKTQSPAEKKEPATPLGEKKEGPANAVSGSKGKGVGAIPSGSATSLPSLRITAIGWDEDPSKRFAFVNGMMVHEGDVIEEAKIVEIYPQHIRFLQNGQYFDIRM